MRRFFCLFILISILAVPVTAQVVTDTIPPPPIDTLTVPDSSISQTDTIVVEQIVDLVSKRPLQLFPQWKVDQGISFSLQVLNHHPYFNFNAAPVIPHSDFKNFRGKEILFYVLITLVLIFALFKLAFAKYFNDLFRVFFRTTLKQRQIREQLMQSPLPSLAFNIFFVATTGLYIAFLLFYYFKKNPVENFWLLYFYCSVGISIIYIVKFAGLKIFGWLFNMKRATEAYTFIVFIINKVIGIFLLPVVVLLAVAGHEGARSLSCRACFVLVRHRYPLIISSYFRLCRHS
ncbi:MAG: DUF4271 domain-containing protein [Chitinophagaceae bacterium]